MTSMMDRAAQVKRIVREQPGIRASEIARQTNVSEATLSLVVKSLRQSGEIQQVKDGRRGLGLKTDVQAERKALLRRRWI